MKVCTLLFFFLLLIKTQGQISTPNPLTDKKGMFFSDGIHLENLNVTIPWNTPPENLKNYGAPKIEVGKKGTTFIWDSAVIVNGVLTKLSFQPYVGRNHRFLYVRGIVDSTNAEKFRKNISSIGGLKLKTKSRKGKVTSYVWRSKQDMAIVLYSSKDSPTTFNLTIQNDRRIAE